MPKAEPVACAACQSGILDTDATKNAVSALLHATCRCAIGFVVRCSVCVQVVDVGMYVCVLRAVRAELQRRHNFDAFLKRLSNRQPQELVRHGTRTATRNSLSDYGLCRHLRLA